MSCRNDKSGATQEATRDEVMFGILFLRIFNFNNEKNIFNDLKTWSKSESEFVFTNTVYDSGVSQITCYFSVDFCFLNSQQSVG